MSEVRQATLEWLKYEDRSESPGGEADPFSLALQETDEQPPIPEPLMWLRRLRAFGSLPYAGGYMEQPYVFMRELEVARDAELEYQLVKQRNLELQAQQAVQQAEANHAQSA